MPSVTYQSPHTYCLLVCGIWKERGWKIHVTATRQPRLFVPFGRPDYAYNFILRIAGVEVSGSNPQACLTELCQKWMAASKTVLDISYDPLCFDGKLKEEDSHPDDPDKSPIFKAYHFPHSGFTGYGFPNGPQMDDDLRDIFEDIWREAKFPDIQTVKSKFPKMGKDTTWGPGGDPFAFNTE